MPETIGKLTHPRSADHLLPGMLQGPARAHAKRRGRAEAFPEGAAKTAKSQRQLRWIWKRDEGTQVCRAREQTQRENKREKSERNPHPPLAMKTKGPKLLTLTTDTSCATPAAGIRAARPQCFLLICSPGVSFSLFNTILTLLLVNTRRQEACRCRLLSAIGLKPFQILHFCKESRSKNVPKKRKWADQPALAVIFLS